MPFIGNKPSAVPLTSADIADSIITSAKIADGTIVNADINASAAIAGTKISGSFGKVLQVVSTNFTSEVTSTSGSFVDVSGFTATITPSSASSKILITVDINFGGTNDAYPAAKLFRDSTEIFSGVNATGSMTACFLGGAGLSSADRLLEGSRTVLDSPNTTSAITYKIQFANVYNSPTYSGYINRTHNKANAAYTHSRTSGITLIEIGA